MEQLPITNALTTPTQAAGPGADVSGLMGAAAGEDAGQKFGLLLSQQLQQLLAQAGITDMPAEKGSPGRGVADFRGEQGLPGRGVTDLQVEAEDAITAQLGLEEGDAAAAGLVGEQTESDALPKAWGLNAQLALGREADGDKGRGHVQSGENGPWHLSLTGRPGLALAIGRKEEVDDADGKKLPQDLPLDDETGLATTTTDPSALAAAAAQASAALTQTTQGTPALDTARNLDVAAEGVKATAGKEVILAKVEVKPEATMESVSTLPQTQQAPHSFSAMLTERVATHAQTPAMPSLEVPHRVDTPQWSQGLGDKVVWMLGSQTQGAELRLNPPALGPLEVRVSMSDGQATLSFMTPHAPVREAIEAAAPRLREMLGDSGINLGSVSVNVGTFAQQQPGSQDASADRQNGAGQWTTNFEEQGQDAVAPSTLVSSVRYLRDGGMVDLFA